MAPLALVANLATRWRHLHYLQIWPPDGATCISCKFGHQMAPLALVANLATRWHWFKIWSSAGATCIPKLVTRLRYLHCYICLGLPYWHYQLVLSCYPHQPESHQLSLHKVSEGLTDGHPDPKIGPQVYLGPIKRKYALLSLLLFI